MPQRYAYLKPIANQHENITFDDVDIENIDSLFRSSIAEHRPHAKLLHACHAMDDAHLAWHLKHADYVEQLLHKVLIKLKQ